MKNIILTIIVLVLIIIAALSLSYLGYNIEECSWVATGLVISLFFISIISAVIVFVYYIE